MATKKLTKNIVDALTASSTDQFIWDSLTPSFGVKCTPRGHKVYLYQYRNGLNANRRLTIGPVTAISLDDARNAARDAAQAVRNGHDPFQDKLDREKAQVTRAALETVTSRTVGDLIDSWMVGYIGKRELSAHYLENVKSITKTIRGWVGTTSHVDVTRSTIVQWHTANAHRPVQANLVIKRFKEIWSWCEVNDLTAPNAATSTKLFSKIDKYAEGKRERKFDNTEYPAFFAALTHHRQIGDVSALHLDALELIMMSGSRKMETLSLRWTSGGRTDTNYVDQEAGEIVLQRHKSDPTRETQMKWQKSHLHKAMSHRSMTKTLNG
jgi:hypothetical protein